MYNRVCIKLLDILQGKSHREITKQNISLINGYKAYLSISITFIDNNLIVNKKITHSQTFQEDYQHWIFQLKKEEWQLLILETNEKIILETTRKEIELNHLIEILEESTKETSISNYRILLNFPLKNNFFTKLSFFPNRLIYLIFPLLIIYFTVLLMIIHNSLFQHSLLKLKGYINQKYEKTNSELNLLSSAVKNNQNNVTILTEELLKQLNHFKLNREEIKLSIENKASNLPKENIYQKRAYQMIAERVSLSQNYQEVMKLLMQLPSSNEAALVYLNMLENKNMRLSNFKFILPQLVYPVRLENSLNTGEDFLITSQFNDKRPLFSDNTGGNELTPHHAIDIANISNISNITANKRNINIQRNSMAGIIVSIADGEIIDIGYNSIYGWFIEIEHNLDKYSELKRLYPQITKWSSFYAHLDHSFNWKKGDILKQNQKIGEIGSSGHTTGPHLHFELRIYKGETFQRVSPFTRIYG